MVYQLVLKEEMIDCFHSCAAKADYGQLFFNNVLFLHESVRALKILALSLENDFCKAIAKNSIFLVNVLRQWRSGEPFLEGLLDMEKEYPDFIRHFREFGSVKDWNDFYTLYKGEADRMISCARNKDVFDFKIECKGILFDNFEKRDKFLEHSLQMENKLSKTDEKMSQMREKMERIEEKREKDAHKLKSKFMSRIREERELSVEKLEETRQTLRKEIMELFASQAQQMENRISEANEKMFQLREELRQSEENRKEDIQMLRNELMELFLNQAQQMESRISETDEKMSLIREELKMSEEKREEHGQKLRNELMKCFESQARQMENRISETNEKIESLNRKLGHFNSSFNEKFNSLEEKLNSMQLDKKMEALSIQKNSGEDFNQFLTKVGDRFNEQQIEMSKKMEKMMEMIKQNGGKSSGDGK